ncbi:MAG: hypothetical protein BGO31_11175 [Bacteroidetes bacterium 43-16]|uniref:DUF4133 domain-containing protein n=1 Tax=uncultured Dysgonomonas sp. TaxID=206096 RepID=UPI00092AB416|nr:DUF4133 domain-containing protein [uncultured Dysgonomonas sp.]OJV51021.1 MAG: hypothetical protein BGO31_11175 [Bacteroidetes bacterium 43-16]
MANSVYKINKGINKSIEFKGFKAQYIWYMVIVILCLLFVFALLYFLGINQYVCILVCGGIGAFSLQKIYGLSKKYGEHGLSKMIARKSVPKVLKSIDRGMFIKRSKSYVKRKPNRGDQI